MVAAGRPGGFACGHWWLRSLSPNPSLQRTPPERLHLHVLAPGVQHQRLCSASQPGAAAELCPIRQQAHPCLRASVTSGRAAGPCGVSAELVVTGQGGLMGSRPSESKVGTLAAPPPQDPLPRPACRGFGQQAPSPRGARRRYAPPSLLRMTARRAPTRTTSPARRRAAAALWRAASAVPPGSVYL